MDKLHVERLIETHDARTLQTGWKHGQQRNRFRRRNCRSKPTNAKKPRSVEGVTAFRFEVITTRLDLTLLLPGMCICDSKN